MKKRKSNIFLKKNHTNILSIQFSLDGFSFCVSDSISKEALFFSEYIFDETLFSFEDLLEKIKQLFIEEPILQYEYKSVFVIHQNPLNTLVPDEFFEEKALGLYLNFNIKTLETDYITFDTIHEINIQNVYIPFVNINNYLFNNFGEFEFKHHTTVLIEKLIQKNHSSEKVMFVNVAKNSIDVVVLESQKLILSNSFSCKTKEDCCYYILFVFEQLQLNTDETALYFLGEIVLESELYQLIFKYIRNVFFLESNAAIFKHFESEKHANFILLG